MDSNIDNIIKTINEKTKRQTGNIILNLDDFESIKITELTNVIIRKANPNGDLKRLREMIIISNGKVSKIFGEVS